MKTPFPEPKSLGLLLERELTAALATTRATSSRLVIEAVHVRLCVSGQWIEVRSPPQSPQKAEQAPQSA